MANNIIPIHEFDHVHLSKQIWLIQYCNDHNANVWLFLLVLFYCTYEIRMWFENIELKTMLKSVFVASEEPISILVYQIIYHLIDQIKYCLKLNLLIFKIII